MGAHSRSVRWFSTLFVAAIGLHELRYLIGPGADAQHSLGPTAHAYLPLAGAFVMLLFGVSAVHFVSTLVLARSGEIRPPKPLRFTPAWLAASLALVAIFLTQESFEGALLSGHSSGFHGLFGHGGWIVLLLAPLFGATMALFLHGAHSVLVAVARRATGTHSRRAVGSRWRNLPDSCPAKPGVLASHLAGRAPPPAFVF